MRILGIETSCDETSIAVLNDKSGVLKLESHYINSQIQTHQKYGGVVPEVAARLHVPNIIKMLAIVKDEVDFDTVDYIALAAGPGLITSLLAGSETAKNLAYLLDKPLILVNHLSAHIHSVFLNKKLEDIKFPALGLLVSGGHTELFYLSFLNEFKVLGRTRDDAVGEAYDKVAKLLGLSYPGGPIISDYASKCKVDNYNFPRPMKNSKNLDFSFSGLKTAVLYEVKEAKEKDEKLKKEISYSFQEAVVDVLQSKVAKAYKKYPDIKSLIVAGGVSANKRLRKVFQNKFSDLDLYFPEMKFCGDNAAMIAADAYIQMQTNYNQNILNNVSRLSKLRPHPNWEINRSIWKRW